MPVTIDSRRKAKLKLRLLDSSVSVRQALKDAGYNDSTAHKSTTNPVVKVCMKEIIQELEDSQLIAKAYNTLSDCLKSDKSSDKIAAAQALLRFKVGEKSNINNLNPEKIIVAYGSSKTEINIMDNPRREEAEKKEITDEK